MSLINITYPLPQTAIIADPTSLVSSSSIKVHVVVLCGYSIWLLCQDGKEKDNSLCSFVPGGDTAVPCWEIWALAC